MMNKRGFLLGAASAVAAPQVLAGAAPAAGGQPLLANGPGLAEWQAYVGQQFTLTDGQRHWAVTLDRADALATAAQTVQTEQFVLAFGNPGPGQIPAGMHALRHANGQGTLIHLAGRGGQAMRAEFNLLRQPV